MTAQDTRHKANIGIFSEISTVPVMSSDFISRCPLISVQSHREDLCRGKTAFKSACTRAAWQYARVDYHHFVPALDVAVNECLQKVQVVLARRIG
jgi:hypothetical protein